VHVRFVVIRLEHIHVKNVVVNCSTFLLVLKQLPILVG